MTSRAQDILRVATAGLLPYAGASRPAAKGLASARAVAVRCGLLFLEGRLLRRVALILDERRRRPGRG